MEKETKELIFLNPKNETEGIWANALPEELQFDSPELPKLQKEIDRLENEIKNFQTRIDQEIALTEKITENIKSRASNPKDVGVMRDVELQWRTTHTNIENIKKMMQPRIEKVEELYKKVSYEKSNLIKELKNEYLNRLANEINALSEGMNYIKNAIETIAVISKTLQTINKEINKTDFAEITPNPIDSFEVFWESYNNYIEKIDNFIKE